jgi:hypothetical protein
VIIWGDVRDVRVPSILRAGAATAVVTRLYFFDNADFPVDQCQLTGSGRASGLNLRINVEDQAWMMRFVPALFL